MCAHRLLAIAAVAISCLACTQQGTGDSARLSPEQSADVRRKIISWLECEECGEGERDSVVRLGTVAVPTLRATLLEGPSPARLEMFRTSLKDTYARLKAYERTHPEARVPLSEQQYLDLYIGNYLALYAVRSATALGLIGGQAATEALQTAAKATMRADARAAIDSALATARSR